MNIILLSNSKEITKTFRLNAELGVLLIVCICLIPVGAGYFGYNQAMRAHADNEAAMASALESHVQTIWREKIELHQQEIEQVKEDADNKMRALTLRIAELQARLVRIDALGERIISSTDLPSDEFDFSQPPPMGGPTETLQKYEALDFIKELDRLTVRVEEREQQLVVLESLLKNKKIEDELFIAGRPILKGWMSSRFGRRTDPFTGEQAWHKGVDFAGKDGSDIVSVASGVVTWAGKKSGYGYLVEVNHGNGYATRYAHCKKMLVKAGDIVRKGQVVALMGSTGRSTGPHVHFEVLKQGVQVDPAKYVKRRAPNNKNVTK